MGRVGFKPYDGNHGPRWPFVLNEDSPQARGLVFWAPAYPTALAEPLELSGRKVGFIQKGTGDDYEVTNLGSQALTLDGSASKFQWDNAVSDWGFTLCTRFKQASITSSTRTLIAVIASGSNIEYCRITADNPTSLLIQRRTSAGGSTNSGQVAFTADVWGHVAGIARTNSGIIYVDGVSGTEDTDVKSTPGTAWNHTALGVTERPTPIHFYSGSLADARVYNRILPQEEILLQVHDPWDLYYELGRRSYHFRVPAAAGISRPAGLYHHRHHNLAA